MNKSSKKSIVKEKVSPVDLLDLLRTGKYGVPAVLKSKVISG
ncbi:MAG TPA: hypothetical protein VMY59_06540 [Candidatus Thermoplasmatota archaeon]|nr:hypothetical protein [Candidatus Thermoplasmatota archaeon]